MVKISGSPERRKMNSSEISSLSYNFLGKLKLKAILIGTDTNREMKSFSTGGSSQSISVFDFNYPNLCPDHCKRKSKPVIDYFLHSSAVAPLHNTARRFHEDEAVLDHHPFHTVFQIGREETVECGNEEVMTRTVKNPPSKASQRVSGTAKLSPASQPRLLEASTANDIIPGASLSKNISTSSNPQGGDDYITPGTSSGLPQVTQGRCTQGSPGQKDIIPGLSLFPAIGKDSKAVDTQITAKGEKKTSAQRAGDKMKQRSTPSGKGDEVPGILGKGQKIESPIMQSRAFSTKDSIAQNDQKLPNTSFESFSCELCRKSFSSRQGLFIHFGRQGKHFPCKHKDSMETCLRVFDTEVKRSQHKETHE